MQALTRSFGAGITLALVYLTAEPALAQRLSGEEAIRALQNGGYVLVMRHATAEIPTMAPRGGGGFGGGGRGGAGAGGPPGAASGGEREPELTQNSINLLTGTRHAFWYFRIPVDAIYASPKRRTTQHAAEVPFAAVTIVNELDVDAPNANWLRAKLREPAMAGTNSIIVTHSNQIATALGMDNVDAGETLVVRPGPEPTVVARLGLRDWSVLALELEP